MTSPSPEPVDPLIAAMSWPPELGAIATANLAWLRACPDTAHYRPEERVTAGQTVEPTNQETDRRSREVSRQLHTPRAGG